MGRGGTTRLSPDYGIGHHSIDVPDVERFDPNKLRDDLLDIFRAPSYRPPVLPGVAIELNALTRKPNVSFDDVAKLLQRDPIIAASVLRVAQSPVYGGRARVGSLRDALARLGIETLRDIVWQVATHMRLFRVKGYDAAMQRLQAHSVVTAYFARLVASQTGVATEHAFLCGLLHDVGISGALIALAETRAKDPPPLAHLWPALDQMHAQASGMMCRLWGLAPEVCDAISLHHGFDVTTARPSPLLSALCVAESLADKLGVMVSPPGQDPIDRYRRTAFEIAVEQLRVAHKLPALEAHARALMQRSGGVPQ